MKIFWESRMDPYQIVTVDESLRTEGDGAALESYSQMSFTTKVAARAIDVLVGSEIYIDSFENKEEYFANLRDLLPEDVFEKLGDPEDPYSISITSQELASELEVAYDQSRPHPGKLRTHRKRSNLDQRTG